MVLKIPLDENKTKIVFYFILLLTAQAVQKGLTGQRGQDLEVSTCDGKRHLKSQLEPYKLELYSQIKPLIYIFSDS